MVAVEYVQYIPYAHRLWHREDCPLLQRLDKIINMVVINAVNAHLHRHYRYVAEKDLNEFEFSR